MHHSLSEDNGLAALTDKDQQIYSVGISTGGLAEMRMAVGHPTRRIIATTIDSEGAAFAQKRIEEAGLSKQIEVKLEDVALPLPYPEGHFDFIYARLVLHYLPHADLIRSLGELCRVLKRGGKIFVVVRSEECPQAQDPNRRFDPDSRMTTYVAQGHSYSRHFHTEGSIQDYLSSSGFFIEHVGSYEEQLCSDFQRTELSECVDTLIEVLATRILGGNCKTPILDS